MTGGENPHLWMVMSAAELGANTTTMETITAYVQDSTIIGKVLSYLTVGDALSFTRTCRQYSGVLAYEYAAFVEPRSYFAKRFAYVNGTQRLDRGIEQSLLAMDTDGVRALLRNPSLDACFMTFMLGIFTRNDRREEAYAILDDSRVKLKGILEQLRRTNCLWNDGPEILWVVEHPRMVVVVKPCSMCHRKWNTQYTICASCRRALCGICGYRNYCRGCNVAFCNSCQASDQSRTFRACDCECNDYRCKRCEVDELCRRCGRRRLCPACSLDGKCLKCC